jgi:hypothetical protein
MPASQTLPHGASRKWREIQTSFLSLYHGGLQKMAENSNPPFPRRPPENDGKFKLLFYHMGLQKMREIQTSFIPRGPLENVGNSNYFFTTLASRKWRENQTLFCPCFLPQIILVKFYLSSIYSRLFLFHR